MTSLGAAQAQLLRTLTRFRVELVVVGGVAAQAHGWHGATNDLDISVAVSVDNVNRLKAALEAVDARSPMVGALGTAYETAHGRLEIVAVADGVGRYEDCVRGSRSAEAPAWGGKEIWAHLGATMRCVTAKEKLRAAVEELSEAEAAEALNRLARGSEPDALDELLDNAPIDEEPTTPEEDAGARQARAEIARGELFTAETIKREVA